MGNTRVDYRERQRLTAADLRSEQAYRLGLMGQHVIAHHRPGVVRGLRLARSPAGICTLSAGIAIDGFGREIVVADTTEIDLPAATAEDRYVLLYYCEDAQQSPPGRQCADDPAPRILQRPLVCVAARYDAPDDAAESYQSARAAGTEGLAPWPVLIAAHRCAKPQPFDLTLTSFAGLRTSSVRSPIDGSIMQIGSTSRTDFFHFLVSTRGDMTAPAKRLGIDRDGDVHVWGALVISGRTAVAMLALGHNLALQIKAPIPAGLVTGLRVQGAFDPQLKTLSDVSMVVGAAPAFGMSRLYSAPAADLKLTSAALAFRVGRMGSVELLDTRRHEVTPFSIGRQRLKRSGSGAEPAPTAEALTAFSLTTSTLDAKLEVSGVVSFKPMAEPAADPLAREVQAVVASKPDDIVPATELRLCGGAQDDTDTTTRVSIGARDDVNSPYVSALRMDGGRRVTIPDRTGKGTRELLVGKKTVYLPPIGAKDPLLPDLLMLAYLNGLWRAGNVTTLVTLKLSNPVIDATTAVQFKYALDVTSTVAFDIKRSFELVSSQDGRGDLSFRSLQVLHAAADAALPTQLQTIDDFRRAEHSVHLVVVMLVEIGGHARLVVSNALPLSY